MQLVKLHIKKNNIYKLLKSRLKLKSSFFHYFYSSLYKLQIHVDTSKKLYIG